MAELSQLFASDPSGFAPALDEARSFFASGATADLNQAAGLVFNLMSSGADAPTREMFRQLAAAGTLRDPAAAAEATRTFQTAIGEDKAGSFRNILNQAFAAAGPGQGTLEELLRGSAKAAPGARALGVSPQSLLAAVGAISTPAGGSQIAGDRLAALFKSLERGGFSGELGTMLDAVQGRLNKGQGFADVFGGTQDFEAIQGFRFAQINRQALDQLVRQVGTADARDLVSKAMGLPDTDPILATARMRQRVTQGNEVRLEEDFGAAGNLLAAAMNDLETQAARDGGVAGAFGTLYGRVHVGAHRMVDGDVAALRNVRQSFALEDPQLREAIDRFLARIDEQTETLKRIEQNQSGRPPVSRVEGRQE